MGNREGGNSADDKRHDTTRNEQRTPSGEPHREGSSKGTTAGGYFRSR